MGSAFNHVSLVYGMVGQTVPFYPPDAELVREGAPTAAATYKVYAGTSSNDDAVEFEGTATLDSVSTTVDAASGYTQTNRQRLYVAATTSISVGERYLVTNAGGQREVITVALIASADYVDLEEPLTYDYASGATVKGIRHYFTVDSTFIADESNITVAGSSALLGQSLGTDTLAPPFRVEWRYTTGSTAQRTWTSLAVVRQVAKSRLTSEQLRGVMPDVLFLEWVVQRGQDFAPQLELAEGDTRLRARAAGFDPDAVRDPEAWDRMVLYAWVTAILRAQFLGGADVGLALEAARSDETIFFEKMLGTALRAFIDTGTKGSITPSPARQLWLRGR